MKYEGTLRQCDRNNQGMLTDSKCPNTIMKMTRLSKHVPALIHKQFPGVNSVYIFDGKLVLTYNFEAGTESVTLSEAEEAFSSEEKSLSLDFSFLRPKKGNNMIWYRVLFLNRKTFSAASVGAISLLIVSMYLMLRSDQMTIFTTVCSLLIFFMSAGLCAAWKKEDLLKTSGLVGAILLVELCRYIYLSEQYLNIGVDTIVSMGLVQCMLLSTYLMICFVIVMVAYNHFTICLGKKTGHTKLIANQISICVLLLCYLVMTVERWLIAGDLLQQFANILSCLSDLCLFIMIACCELYLAVDGQILTVYREGE